MPREGIIKHIIDDNLVDVANEIIRIIREMEKI